MHDTFEDTAVTYKDIGKEFGKDIVFLVNDMIKLSKQNNAEHINSLKKMFFAMAEDIRIILIKLADRYHNMETSKAVSSFL